MLPQTTMGMLTRMPKITRVKSPLAAAATAMTLSRLITASAMMMVRIAPNRWALPSIYPCSPSSSGCSNLTPIHSNRAPPTIFKNGMASSCRAKKKKHAQSDGSDHAPENALPALLLRQTPADQRDHDGIIATEQNVDGDDLQDRNPEPAGSAASNMYLRE